MLEWDKDTTVNGDFYIHKNTLNTYIGRSEYEVAKHDDVDELKRLADVYVRLLMGAIEYSGLDSIDLVIFPQTRELEVLLKGSPFYGKTIDYKEFIEYYKKLED